MIRIAQTENGMVQGLPAADPRITSFKGIPFAAPPVGENRWRKPMPCDNWEGIRLAYEYGPISMQDTPGLGDDIYCREWHVDPEIPMDEDCLYLNVWTSAKSADEKLPVFVWFFGGALQWGYPSEMEFDGERIARRGIVVVTVNYRLGPLGFLAHPEISKNQPDAPGNFGNLDQQAGLKWVIRNIANFGGDPNNITIGGQSAGGGSVMTQMASDTNEGLFQKAIVMSGMIRTPYMLDIMPPSIFSPIALEEAEKLGERFFEYLGVKTLDEARKLDALFIRDKYAEFAGMDMSKRFFTICDGKFCTKDPFEAFVKGDRVRVPVMSGNTEDEFKSFIPKMDGVSYEDTVKKLFGDDAEKFMSFPEAKDEDEMGYALVSSIEPAVKAAFLAESRLENPQPCYYYRFRPHIPGEDNPGTFHSVDLWFFFETLAKATRPYNGKHFDLARQMCNYYANFIKTGNPNGKDADGTDMPVWNVFNAKTRAEMEFTTDGSVAKVDDNECMSFLAENMIKTI